LCPAYVLVIHIYCVYVKRSAKINTHFLHKKAERAPCRVALFFAYQPFGRHAQRAGLRPARIHIREYNGLYYADVRSKNILPLDTRREKRLL
jgi:hypothetical protein